ncbi:MAG: hypothetical protein M9958_11205 [Chitinophagales bacterium]|nr:hypothetical protein [Chitinophagales bacterium]
MKKILLFGWMSFFLWGCQQQCDHSSTHQHSEEHTEHHHHQESTNGIVLQNGAKWQVNNEMKPFVLKGEKAVNLYVQENGKNFNSLAIEVGELNNQLIKSCTMDGQSHDELHKWLEPHLELVKNLEEEKDSIKASEIVLQLQNSYQQYHQYFE